VSRRPGVAASLLTAEARGAIAVIRVWGPGAVALTEQVFRPRKTASLSDSPPGRLRLGRVGAGLGDEVVAVVVETPRGPEVDLQCHGGPAAVGLVLESLVAAGAQVRSARAWARHATGSFHRAVATVALGNAPTLRTAEILLEQAEGALDRELAEIIKQDISNATKSLNQLIDRGALGLRLVSGWRVVLAGRPNVGKSRLTNALAGFDRAIVAPTPGTTRDVVTVRAAVNGWPIELADTAGLRATTDPLEASGVDRARQEQTRADLVIVVLDRSEPLTDTDQRIRVAYPESLVVANKVDLPGAWDEADAIGVSAERGDGVARLVDAIADRIVPAPPPPGAGVPLTTRQLAWLRAIRSRLEFGDRDRFRRSLQRWCDDSLARER
jgi:tRNA modification GTPase